VLAATLGPRREAGVLVACGHAKGASKRNETHNIEMILRIRGEVPSVAGMHSLKCHEGYINSLVSYSTLPTWSGVAELERKNFPPQRSASFWSSVIRRLSGQFFPAVG
jgi:hypothetical protein